MGSADTENYGEQVAALLRGGSRAQYDEVQQFVLNALRRGERIDGEMIMEIIWSLLPKTAQKKISAGKKPAISDGARSERLSL
jgi:hypothetical protein